ncbi:MAG TPA: VTT domain-containing protein [Rhizomicrobium sp.]
MIKVLTRVMALAIVLAGIALAVVYRAYIHPLAIRDAIASNPFAPALFIGLQIAASLLWVPRTVMGIAAGLIFGLAWGFIWAMVGAVAGASAGFAFARLLGADGVLDTSPRIGRLVQRAETGGSRAVAILRLIPGLPHSLVNTLLALTRVPWRSYLLGSLLGMMPMTFVQVGIGASGSALFEDRAGWIAACLLLAVALAVSFLVKRVAARQ